MTSVKASTLRPGLLVSLKTSVRGNVQYRTVDLEAEKTEDGAARAKWETERTIADAIEYEGAKIARTKCRSLITAVCSQSAFGLLCPENNAEGLDKAIAEARTVAECFNSTAKMTRISVYALVGRVAADDVEAVKAISSEVRDLLGEMQEGIKNCDPAVIRKAAAKAKEVGAMLSFDAEARVTVAIETARAVANKIVKAGEAAAVEVDAAAIRKLDEARTLFLDLDDVKEVAEAGVDQRAFEMDTRSPEQVEAAIVAAKIIAEQDAVVAELEQN